MSQAQSNPAPGLLDLIYDAVANPSRWQMFLEAFVRATTSKRGTLVLTGAGPPLWNVVSWHGWRDEEIRLHTENYAAIDPWSVEIQEGEIRLSHEICSDEDLEKSVAYQQFYGPCGIYYGFGGTILRTNVGASALIVCRGREDGPYGEREVSILRPLMGHLRRAALLHGEFSAMRAQLSIFSGHLDRYPHPFLLVDAECRLLYANSAAHEVVAIADGLAMENGRIVLLSSRQSKLLASINDVARGQDPPVRHIEVPRLSKKRPYRLVVMNIPRLGALPFGTSQPAAAVLLMDSEAALEPDPTILREVFSLTPAEARITARLILGRSVEAIALEAGVSVETVRSQVRSVLSKTGTNRQGELISLVLRTAPFRRL